MATLFEGEVDEADEFLEADELDEADEWDEAARRPRTPVRVASGRDLARQRATSKYVTQQQLETTIARVGAQIRTNSNAVARLETRVTTTASALRKDTAAAMKKEAAARKDDGAKIRSSLSQTQQMAALMPLLTQQPAGTVTYPGTAPLPISIQATGAAGAVSTYTGSLTIPPASMTVQPAGNSTMSLLLPMLLFMGIGDGSSSGSGGLLGGGGSGDNSTMMMLVLVLALSGGLNK
ncbi:hypothetical protein PQQ96_31925 [Paraburkholderia sediminicola]|uniref:hypothetical protein n=1 Tax=Paraburkholderia sediminicola TaxID=458836 RepID=UPI0038BBC3DA